eukprot:1153220-Pelagomonas_calceolata.AAC.2
MRERHFYTLARRRNLMRVGLTWPVRLLRSSSYSEKLPSNHTAVELSSKAKMWVAMRSRNQLQGKVRQEKKRTITFAWEGERKTTAVECRTAGTG